MRGVRTTWWPCHGSVPPGTGPARVGASSSIWTMSLCAAAA